MRRTPAQAVLAIASLACLAALGPARGAEPARPASGPTTHPASAASPATPDIARLVADLAHRDPTVRAATTAGLIAVGRPAVDAVRAAAASDDPELAGRAAHVLANLSEWDDATAGPAVDGLRARLTAARAQVRVGEPVDLTLAFLNDRPAAVTLDAADGVSVVAPSRGYLFTGHRARVTVKQLAGEPAPPGDVTRACGAAPPRAPFVLEPRTPRAQRLTLVPGEAGGDEEKPAAARVDDAPAADGLPPLRAGVGPALPPGLYEVRVTYSFSPGRGELETNVVRFDVVP